MARIRSKNTKPEMVVRRILHRLGYRFRVHFRDLPGSPDLAFTRRRKAIQVQGCFWHQHDGCRLARVPTSRLTYWGPKLERNRERDLFALAETTRMGWETLVIWECETTRTIELRERLVAFLGPSAVDRDRR